MIARCNLAPWLIAGLLAFYGKALRGVDIYMDFSSWEAALTASYETEDFESAPTGTFSNGTSDLGGTVKFNIGYFGVQGANFSGITESSPIQGTKMLNIQVTDTVHSNETNLWQISFAQPMFAFGATWNSISGSSDDPVLTPQNNSGFNLSDYFASEATTMFLGFTSGTAFNNIKFTATNTDDQFHMDSAVFAVPEPAHFGLVAGILAAGMIWFRRRRMVGAGSAAG